MAILDKIKEIQEKSRKRNFNQTWDLIITLTGVDLSKPQNRFNVEFQLPKGRGKEPKVCAITDTLTPKAKKAADMVITKAEISSLAKDKKKFRKIANTYDWFLAEASLMAEIGKSFGVTLGKRGKMPKPLPPKAPVEPAVKTIKNSVRVTVKTDPVIQVPVGTQDMKLEDVAANLEAVYNFIKEKLPKGKSNIRKVIIKLTMGKPVKLRLN